MDNIHTPTVPTSSSSNGFQTQIHGEQPSLIDLTTEKIRIEKELESLSNVLDTVREQSIVDTKFKINDFTYVY